MNKEIKAYIYTLNCIDQINEKLCENYEYILKSLQDEYDNKDLFQINKNNIQIIKEYFDLNRENLRINDNKYIHEIQIIIEKHNKALKLYKDFENELLESEKKFSDILKNGPKSIAEFVIIEMAKLYMQPHELEEVIRNGTTIKDVIIRIENSKIMSVNKNISIQHHEFMMQESKKSTLNSKSIDHQFDLLSRESGILSSIEKVNSPSKNVDDFEDESLKNRYKKSIKESDFER